MSQITVVKVTQLDLKQSFLENHLFSGKMQQVFVERVCESFIA